MLAVGVFWGVPFSPRLPVVVGHVDQPVISARPQQPLLQRRLGERKHGVVVLDAGDVERDRSARGPLLALVVAGEIGADAPPAASLIGTLQHELRRRVQNFRIVPRDEHRFGPLYAVLEIFRTVTGYVEGMYRDVAQVAGAMIVARHLAAVGIRVDDLRVAWIGRDVATFAATHLIPVLPADDAFVVAAGDGDRGVVLLGAVDAIGPVIVHDDVIELRRWLVVLLSPAVAAIDGNGRAAVITVDHAPGIARVYPQRVMITVRSRQQLEILAAVAGAKCAGIQHVHGIERDRIREDVRVVPGTLPEAVIGIDPRPAAATVIGAEDSALLRLAGGIDEVGNRAGDGNTDAPERPVGQAVVFDELPGEAPVGRSIETRSGAAAREAPRFAAHLPQRSEQGIRVAGIEDNIDHTRVAVVEQHPLPALAAIAGAEDAALVGGAEP